MSIQSPQGTTAEPLAAAAGHAGRWDSAGAAFWLALAVSLLAAYLAMRSVRAAGFIDVGDRAAVAQNFRMVPATWGTVGYYWTHAASGQYAPLTYTLWAVLAHLAQRTPPGTVGHLDPQVFHLASLVLHLAGVGLVLIVLRKLLGRVWPATVGTLLFAVHPVQVEPVAWIAQTKVLLGGLLALVAIDQYVTAAMAPQNQDHQRGAGAARIGWLYGSAVAALLGAMLADPATVAVPLVLIVIDRLVLGRSWRRVLRWALLPLALAIPLIIVAWRVNPPHGPPLPRAMWGIAPVAALDALAFYLYKLTFPLHLGIDYGRTSWWLYAHPWACLTAGVPLVVAGLLWVFRRQVPVLVAGALVSLACLLPTLGLLPSVAAAPSTVADHRLYLAMLGIALAGGWAVMRWDRPGVRTGAVLIVIALGVRAAAQTRHWRDSETLLEHALDVNAQSWVACDALAVEDLRAHHVGEALRRARAATMMAQGSAPRGGTYAPVHVTMGRVLAASGDQQSAIGQFMTALTADPYNAAAHAYLGQSLLAHRSDIGTAEAHCLVAITLDPSLAAAHVGLAEVYVVQGRGAEAERELRLGVQLDPWNADTYVRLATVLVADGRSNQAATVLRQAVNLDPHSLLARPELRALLDGGRLPARSPRSSPPVQPDTSRPAEPLSRAMTGSPERDYRSVGTLAGGE